MTTCSLFYVSAISLNNYETAAKKELGRDYPKLDDEDKRAPLAAWREDNTAEVADFKKQMRLKVHYVVEPQYLWNSIYEMARNNQLCTII